MSQIIKEFQSSTNHKKIFCFPFAGGYSVSFRPLNTYLQDFFHILAIEPPGHGTNRTKLNDNFEELVNIYIQELTPLLDGVDFALFGHSMGGLIVYRLAQEMEKKGVFPRAIFISATKPPQHKYTNISNFDDTHLINYLIKLGGIPKELVQSKELLQFFLPIFRADFKALETFKHNDHTLLQSPVHIFNGKLDHMCFQHSSGWNRWANEVHFHNFSGGHMFLNSEVEEVAKKIRLILNNNSL
ncbi:thioesterase [Bacillus wiedmannii]|uniref:thioesterase II family protein n=1 Tax=Bacillus wiedmannii TaxID=1890302 RepID=UPI0010BF0451|nr:alpha/beta fold hydrolase [Bacillus wiedmannii]TKI09076.1 thioesterase [Bacillus wiedmannii]